MMEDNVSQKLRQHGFPTLTLHKQHPGGWTKHYPLFEAGAQMIIEKGPALIQVGAGQPTGDQMELLFNNLLILRQIADCMLRVTNLLPRLTPTLMTTVAIFCFTNDPPKSLRDFTSQQWPSKSDTLGDYFPDDIDEFSDWQRSTTGLEQEALTHSINPFETLLVPPVPPSHPITTPLPAPTIGPPPTTTFAPPPSNPTFAPPPTPTIAQAQAPMTVLTPAPSLALPDTPRAANVAELRATVDWPKIRTNNAFTAAHPGPAVDTLHANSEHAGNGGLTSVVGKQKGLIHHALPLAHANHDVDQILRVLGNEAHHDPNSPMNHWIVAETRLSQELLARTRIPNQSVQTTGHRNTGTAADQTSTTPTSHLFYHFLKNPYWAEVVLRGSRHQTHSYLLAPGGLGSSLPATLKIAQSVIEFVPDIIAKETCTSKRPSFDEVVYLWHNELLYDFGVGPPASTNNTAGPLKVYMGNSGTPGALIYASVRRDLIWWHFVEDLSDIDVHWQILTNLGKDKIDLIVDSLELVHKYSTTDKWVLHDLITNSNWVGLAKALSTCADHFRQPPQYTFEG
ncbi:hypothetical protein DXG01_015884 [Tephrocybe rancida]|nr:hypothetical protein DXG01_015884 [Tephrocybe rancida]